MTTEIADRLKDLFDDELSRLIRRVSDQPRVGEPEEGNHEIRSMVWKALVDLGALEADFAGEVRIAEILGTVLYQGPYLDTLAAAGLLFPASDNEPTADPERTTPVGASISDGAGWTVDGDQVTATRVISSAPEARAFVVCGPAEGEGWAAALLPADHPSVRMTRIESAGRGEDYRVSFEATPVTRWIDTSPWYDVNKRLRLRQAAYLVGVAQAALDHACAYARTRRQFGQPIGKFQSIAFRLSEMHVRIDSLRSLVHDPTGPDYAAANLASAAELAIDITTACMQIVGATAMVESNDAQLFYRKAGWEAVRLGTPAQMRLASMREEPLPLMGCQESTDI